MAWEFEVQKLTAYGWECVTTEVDREAARDQLACYRENDPDNAYRYKRVRE